MQKSRARFSLLLCAVACISIAAAQELTELTPLTPAPVAAPTSDDETPQRWFVELASAPAAQGTSLAALNAEKAAFRAAARAAGIQFTERFAFGQLWNGLSISVSPAQLSRLSAISGVRNLYPVVPVAAPRATAAAPELFNALSLTGADVAQSALGLTGAGVRVAVMDTGIDYDHPDLGGCFGPGCRVAKGWDFVGDAFNADPTSPSYNPVPLPDNDPDDCGGHGTHVAGIVGANGTVKGVAPGVTLYAYRVFGCEGSTQTDIMIAAMERALADGAHILNVSIGSAFQWPNYPTAQAADRLVNKGVVVVASAGNSGANGLYSGSAPGMGKKVIGVAAFDNVKVTLPAFEVTPDGKAIGYTAATGAPEPPTSGTFPMARTGTATTNNDACAALPAGSLAGKIALIRRGTCGFYNKALNAQNAGAAGVILYNNASGFITPTVVGTPAITIPVVMITAADGVLINDRLAAGPVDLTWTANVTGTPNPTGGLISSFSSYGLAPDLSLKPDLGAPGGSIYSTYPLELGGYENLGGTSMAAPHVAGAAALLLEARPNTPAQAVDTILQNTAVPAAWWGNPALGFLDNVHRQGAGMLRIDDAIMATTRVEPSELALGESQPGPATALLTIRNHSSQPVTYDVAHVPALSTGANTFVPSFTTGFASALIVPSTLTVPPGASGLVSVTVTANLALAEKSLYGGYIVVTPQGSGEQAYRVPYAGFKGDYQAIPVLTPTPNNFPWLAKLAGSSYVKQAAGAAYSMVGNDVPFFLLHLDHPSRLLRMEVFQAVTGKAWHRAYQQEYLPRNSAAASFFAFSWDGVTYNGRQMNTVPNGNYVVKISVLRALGDSSNPAHWDTWTSPVITLARP